MAIPKVLGIETEYGVAGGPQNDPIAASGLLVSSYAHVGGRFINWDFRDEAPGSDLRGTTLLTSIAPLVETHLANAVLANGSRFYVDHAHPEYSSPEVRTPRQAVLYDLAGEEILRRAMLAANRETYSGDAVVVYKNNSDGKGNSYGCHENYLVRRDIEFTDIVKCLVPHFVTRQVMVGSGKVGWETDSASSRRPVFQVSQRAEFFEEVVGLETTLKRPIINTRDEPHGDHERFRRLHVIVGDANSSQVATFLKLGTTGLLLALLEDVGIATLPPLPVDPVRAIHTFAMDTSLTSVEEFTDGKMYSALDIQEWLWRSVNSYLSTHSGDAVAPRSEIDEIMSYWRSVLDGLRSDVSSMSSLVEWVAKKNLISSYAQRHALAWDDVRLKAIDLQFHDLRPEKNLAARMGFTEMFNQGEIERAVNEPPEQTRAYFRGRCVSQYGDSVVSANWDSLVFGLKNGELHRVPMMDPMRGTAELTRELFDRCNSAEELITALGM